MCEPGDLLKAKALIYFAFNPTAVSERDVESYNFWCFFPAAGQTQ